MDNGYDGTHHNHNIDMDEAGHSQARRRKPEGLNENAGLYSELERLRSLVDVMEGDNRSSSCFKLSLDNSMMSTIFGLVFAVIVTVTFYAFFSLYKAISKRFFQDGL